MKKRMIAAVLAVLFLSGCGLKETQAKKLPKGAAENEILTVDAVDQSKELLTIHYEYGVDNANEIETAIERNFPNVDVVMVFGYSQVDMALQNGFACDILISRRLPSISSIAPEYLLDLGGEAFINNYYLTSLNSCLLPDGGVYYLPGPSNVHGIIYDKTVMEENGWKVPHSYSEFVELIHTIDNSGLTVIEDLDGETNEVPVRAIRPSIRFADALQSTLYPYFYKAVFEGQENLEWLTRYQHGQDSMVGHMEPMAETLQRLLSDGVIRLEDWDYMPRYRVTMLCGSHSTVMISGPQNTYSNDLLVSSDHEYGMMPYWTSDEPDSDYLYSVPSFYMAINKASAEVSPERKQLLLDIMAFLSDPNAQEEIYGKGNAFVSNIKGVPVDEVGFSKDLKDTIQAGRIISEFPLANGDTGRNVEDQLNTTVRDMLTGTITVEQWLTGADEIRDKYLAGELETEPEVFGSCEETLTKLETALLMGQIYRDVTGADIGLVYVNPHDQGANSRIYAGDILLPCVNEMAPDRTSAAGEGIASGTLTGQQILDCLNGMEGVVGHSDGWYYVASGLKVEFAPWMPSGERLVSCKLADGSDIDPNGTYHVAFMSDKIFGKSGNTTESIRPADTKIVEGKWQDIFRQWVADHGGVVKRPEQTTVLNWRTKE